MAVLNNTYIEIWTFIVLFDITQIGIAYITKQMLFHNIDTNFCKR